MAKIDYLKSILADENKLHTVIKEEIEVIRDKFGDERRTKIGINVGDLSDEDFIPEEDTVVAMTNLGYIKSLSIVCIPFIPLPPRFCDLKLSTVILFM